MKIKAINNFAGAKFALSAGEQRADLPDEVCADLIATGYAESAEDKGEVPAAVKKIVDAKLAARAKAKKEADEKKEEKPLTAEEKIALLEAENEKLKKASAKKEEK